MNKTELLASVIKKSLSYAEYIQLTENLLSQGKTTGPNQGADYVHYTNLNFHRMKRLDKTVEINTELQSLIAKIQTTQTWLVISEAWCGDAAQNVPLLQKIADLSNKIELKIILRDENLEVMDLYLTNGGRSIPKLIALENTTLNELYTWGPRPASIQNVMNELKAANITEISEIVEKIQIAYNHDKSQSFQNEFIELLTEYLN
jgi:signal recognition particle subunit SEC65